MWNQTFEHPMIIITPREYSTVRLGIESGYSGSPLLKGHCPQGLRTSLSYLRVFWRTAQQSFTSLCFCATRAASAGCRLESWETLTSSIWNHRTTGKQTQASGWCLTRSWTNAFRVSAFTARDYNGMWILDRAPWFDWQCPEFPRLWRFPLHGLQRGFFSGWEVKNGERTVNNILRLHQHVNIQTQRGYIRIKGQVKEKRHRYGVWTEIDQRRKRSTMLLMEQTMLSACWWRDETSRASWRFSWYSFKCDWAFSHLRSWQILHFILINK